MNEKYNVMETEFETETELEINDKNCINVGFKNSNAYVLFGLRQIMNGNSEVVFRARGNQIPKAITVACILKKNYLKDLNFR